jgi:pimeloyl-ACP methyl ester carboxylesterase
MSVEEARRQKRRPPTLVCVHGLSGSARWWSGVVPRVEHAGPVVVLDLPRSLAPLRLPEWVAEQLEGLEPPVDVAGHSLGGLVVARLAGLRPDLVRRLVLIAPPGIRPRRSMIPYVWPLLVTVARSRPALLRRLTADALRAGPRNLFRGGWHASTADVRADLEAVVAPTLLVWGARDAIVPPVEGRVWRDALADARLVVLSRAGHVPMIDAADELADAIVAFREKPLDELGDVFRV